MRRKHTMKSMIKMSLAAALGLVAGALGMQALHAQTSSVPAFLVANIESISDAATFAQYRAETGKTQAPFGGRVLVRDAPPVPVDASSLPQGKIVIVQFPSMQALQDWWKSPAYTQVRPLREKSSVSRIFAVDGVPAP
jgi:uncharacterized protein (DUF1330 family)